MCVGVCWCVLVRAGACLGCVGVRSRVLVRAGECWHVLVYDACVWIALARVGVVLYWCLVHEWFQCFGVWFGNVCLKVLVWVSLDTCGMSV